MRGAARLPGAPFAPAPRCPGTVCNSQSGGHSGSRPRRRTRQWLLRRILTAFPRPLPPGPARRSGVPRGTGLRFFSNCGYTLPHFAPRVKCGAQSR